MTPSPSGRTVWPSSASTIRNTAPPAAAAGPAAADGADVDRGDRHPGQHGDRGRRWTVGQRGLWLYLKEVTVTGNQAINGGGMAGPPNGGQPFSNIERSLFANNTATGNGGGIYHYGQIATLNNSTIDNNRAANGGGLYIDLSSGGESHMSFTTVTRNQASVKAGAFTLFRTPPSSAATSSRPTPRPHRLTCSWRPTSPGSPATTSWETTPAATTAIQNGVNGNIVSTANPLVGPVVNAGGPTFTRPLTTGSPAINKVASGTPIDARGVARPVGASRDIGAFEGACTLNNTQLVTNPSSRRTPRDGTPRSGPPSPPRPCMRSPARAACASPTVTRARGKAPSTTSSGKPRPATSSASACTHGSRAIPASLCCSRCAPPARGASTVYTPLATGTATNTGWVALSGNGLVPNCTLTELVVYAEGPRTGVILHIDNVTVARQTVSCWHLAAGIASHGHLRLDQ